MGDELEEQADKAGVPVRSGGWKEKYVSPPVEGVMSILKNPFVTVSAAIVAILTLGLVVKNTRSPDTKPQTQPEKFIDQLEARLRDPEVIEDRERRDQIGLLLRQLKENPGSFEGKATAERVLQDTAEKDTVPKR